MLRLRPMQDRSALDAELRGYLKETLNSSKKSGQDKFWVDLLHDQSAGDVITITILSSGLLDKGIFSISS